jgi:hypothetical protein
MLSGISSCSVCGGSVKVLGGRDGKKPIKVHGCANHHDAGASVCANTLRKPVELVDQRVADWLDELLTEQFGRFRKSGDV